LVSVVLLLMHQQFLPLSTEIMLRKEIWWTRAQLYTIDFAIRKSREKLLKRKYGFW
jgi:hypothetical protein